MKMETLMQMSSKIEHQEKRIDQLQKVTLKTKTEIFDNFAEFKIEKLE